MKKLRDANSRYKSLLTLARSRIEEQEKQIQELENRIASLGPAPPQNGGSGGSGGGGDDGGDLDTDEWEVRSVYRVVESEGSCEGGDTPMETWALMDFVRIVREDAPPAPEGHAGGRRRRWVKFGDLQELADHVRRDAGEPVVLPEPCLGPAEVQAAKEAAAGEVASASEEFRRYRVKAEIARRQHEQALKAARGGAAASVAAVAPRVAAAGDREREAAQARSAAGRLTSLQRDYAEQGRAWKARYDALQRENEALRGRGADAAGAGQWRRRYDAMLRERDDWRAKWEMQADGGGDSVGGGAATVEVAPPLPPQQNAYERKYRELKEEYKLYRKKAKEMFDSVNTSGGSGGKGDNGSGSRGRGSRESGPTASEQDIARLAYLHSLMVNYLSSPEGSEAKVHMERAIGTVLRFTEEDRAGIRKKKEEGTGGGDLADAIGFDVTALVPTLW